MSRPAFDEPAAEPDAPAPRRRPRAYASATIEARRRRILVETMALISALGIDGFGLDELSRRAGVAKKTLYNSFGSRDAIINAAFDFFLDEQETRFPAADLVSLAAIVETLRLRCIDFIFRREWAKSTSFLYFAVHAEPALHAKLRDLSLIYLRAFLHLHRADPDLLPGLPQPALETHMANVAHGTVHDWVMGRVADADFPDAVCFGFLLTLRGMTRGALQEAIGALLGAVSARLAAAGQASVASAAGL